MRLGNGRAGRFNLRKNAHPTPPCAAAIAAHFILGFTESKRLTCKVTVTIQSTQMSISLCSMAEK